MSKKLVINLENCIDLGISMLPSFASSLFEYDPSRYCWIKYLGYGRGCKIYVAGSKAICEGDMCSEDVLQEWFGLWFNPFYYIKSLPTHVRDEVEAILECIPGLRIITSSFDSELIAVAVFLSKRTDYHVNVIKWVRELASCNLTKSCIEGLAKRYGSYQLRQLSKIINNLISICKGYRDADPWRLRSLLLSIKYVGPKITDAYLLFTKYGSIFTPADIHYRRFLSRTSLLGLELEKAIVPSKDLCLKYGPRCPECKLRDKCITGISIKVFRELSGFIQTAAYVIDKLLSRRAFKHMTMYIKKEVIRDTIKCLIRNDVIKETTNQVMRLSIL